MTGEERFDSETGSGPVDSGVERLAEEFLASYRRGEIVSVSEYEKAHPNMAGVIREYFPGLLLLEKFHAGGTERSRESGELPGELEGGPDKRPRLGEFELLSELGRGGMGVVYESLQTTLDRRVAVKVLPFRSLADDRLKERFELEARAAARLDHPGIVPVYGSGEVDGVSFFAMKLIPGQGLDRVVDEVRRVRSAAGAADLGADRPGADGPGAERPESDPALEHTDSSTSLALSLLLDERESPGVGARKERDSVDLCRSSLAARSSFATYCRNVARVGVEAARALDYAHGQGVLHRDIKPSNLLLDESRKTWITDFGLAKDVGMESLTMSGEIIGTLRYMAPERFAGDSDARSDVYSLGITLYELATLRPAFSDHDRGALVRKVLEEDPPTPRAIEPQIPKALDIIISKAIRKQPEARYPSAAALARDLERFLEGERVRPDRGYLLRRFAKRHRMVVTLTSLLILTGIGFLVRGCVLSQTARGPNDMRVADFDGDGRPDVVTANWVSRNVSVLLSTRDFAALVTSLPVDAPAANVVTADLNGDRHVDLVVRYYASDKVSVLFNDGRGFFPRAASFALPEYVTYATTADLDNDGRADLAVTGDRAVWVLGNAGGAEFSAPRSVEVDEIGSKLDFVVATDCDGDGLPDLITKSESSRRIWILANRGAGSFELVQNLDAGGWTYRLTVADLDADGDPDLASVNYDYEKPSRSEVAVFLNHGGLFDTAVRYPAAAEVQAIESADLDGDGHVDLVAVGGADNIVLFPNRGDATFGNSIRVEAGTNPTAVRAADWDRDGDLDLVVSSYGSHEVTVVENRGRWTFASRDSIPLSRW